MYQDNFFKNFIFKIWELPQNVLGWIVMKAVRAKLCYSMQRRGRLVYIYHWKLGGGMSLGKYIFVPFPTRILGSEYECEYISHEFGHSLQSKKLGWLYLLVIGLPSIIWAGCFGRYRKKHNVSYYEFYTERWADKLGGVRR